MARGCARARGTDGLVHAQSRDCKFDLAIGFLVSRDHKVDFVFDSKFHKRSQPQTCAALHWLLCSVPALPPTFAPSGATAAPRLVWGLSSA